MVFNYQIMSDRRMKILLFHRKVIALKRKTKLMVSRKPIPSEDGNLFKVVNKDNKIRLKPTIYMCAKCSFAFRGKSDLIIYESKCQKYNRVIQPPSASPGPPILKFFCFECSFETQNSAKFKKHRLMQHGVSFISSISASNLLDIGKNLVNTDSFNTDFHDIKFIHIFNLDYFR